MPHSDQMYGNTPPTKTDAVNNNDIAKPIDNRDTASYTD